MTPGLKPRAVWDARYRERHREKIRERNRIYYRDHAREVNFKTKLKRSGVST